MLGKRILARRWIIPIIFFFVIVFVAPPVCSGKAKRPHPQSLTYPPLQITRPEAIEIALANGLEGFLVEDHELPLVDIELLVKTSFPEQKKYGLNEMAQWVMRNGGSAAWPADKLNDELEFLAAWVQIYGDDLSTSITLNCLKKDLPRALEIFADLVTHPSFPRDKIEIKRKTMLEDIRRKDDYPDFVAWREFYDLLYKGHPYGLETTRSGVKAITKKDLLAFHQRYFHPKNAIIGISGDVTKTEIVEALNKALGGWQPAAVAIPKVPEITDRDKKSCHYAYMDVNQAYIMVGHQGINVNNPDRCALNIMNFILGGDFTSWITRKVRNDEGLAYSTGSSFRSDPWTKGLFYAYAQTKAGDYSRSLRLIIQQIERMRAVGPTEKEFRKAIDSYLNRHAFDYESKDQIVSRLVRYRFQGRPLDSLERDMETYAGLTRGDVRRVAREYLHPDKLAILVVGSADLFDRPLSEFGEVHVITLKKD
jgi:predicted Zn-dependent peptidase